MFGNDICNINKQIAKLSCLKNSMLTAEQMLKDDFPYKDFMKYNDHLEVIGEAGFMIAANKIAEQHCSQQPVYFHEVNGFTLEHSREAMRVSAIYWRSFLDQIYDEFVVHVHDRLSIVVRYNRSKTVTGQYNRVYEPDGGLNYWYPPFEKLKVWRTNDV